MTDQAKKIGETIRRFSGRYSPHSVFSDWIQCCALSIANTVAPVHGDIWQEREDSYVNTMKKYELEERVAFSDMFWLLTESMETEISDTLGEIYMTLEMGSNVTGQFFTPFHLSELIAKMAIPESIQSNPDEVTTLNEPACGSGGMIIAMAKGMQDRGINYQKRLRVVAQDIDWRCVHMCYVQLSLLGIRGLVVQGSTLQDPYVPGVTESRHVLITPSEMLGGVML